MILTVTPNPALDTTWAFPDLEAGKSHRVPAGTTRAGGKGLNVARVLHAQGIDVLALTTAGGAPGDELATELTVAGVPHLLLPVAGATRRSSALVETSTGRTTVLNETGADLHPAEADALVSTAIARGAESSASAVSGSLPPGFTSAHLSALVAGVRTAGRPILVDTSGPALLTAAEAGASALKPNHEELAEATGLDDPLAGARALIARGAGLVIASLGEQGLLAVPASGSAVRARLPRIVRGNPTGAGDAVAAAVVHALADDPHLTDLPALARRAAAWGAAAVAMPLAGELSPDVAAFERDVEVTVLEEDRCP